MTRSQSLITPEPTHIVRQPVTICHVCVFHLTSISPRSCISGSRISTRQLRDLIICPDERGVVNYVQDQNIMERDITDPTAVSLFGPFVPCLSFLVICKAKKKKLRRDVRVGNGNLLRSELLESVFILFTGDRTLPPVRAGAVGGWRDSQQHRWTHAVPLMVPGLDPGLALMCPPPCPQYFRTSSPSLAISSSQMLMNVIIVAGSNVPSLPQLCPKHHRLPSHPRF